MSNAISKIWQGAWFNKPCFGEELLESGKTGRGNIYESLQEYLPLPVDGTGGGGGAVATSSTVNSSPVTGGAMAVVTSLTLTEAETAVHLPAPPSPSSATTVAVAGQTINVSVDNSRCTSLIQLRIYP